MFLYIAIERYGDMTFQIDATSNWILLETRLKECMEEGKHVVLVNSQNHESKWFLLASSLYHPHIQGKKFWNSLSPKASPLKKPLQLVFRETNTINLREIAGSPIISEVLYTEKSNSKKKYLLVGILNQLSSNFREICEISSFFKRNCSFAEIKVNFYFVFLQQSVRSYFVLEIGTIKKVAEIFEGFLIENRRNIAFTSFRNPSFELSRALVGEPPRYYSKINIEGRFPQCVDSLKKTVTTDPSPFIYVLE